MDKWEKFKERIKRGLESPDDEEILNENSKSPKYGVIIPQISAKREQELIEKIVSHIKKMKMETVAILTLEMYRPVSRPFGQIYGFYSAPVLELFGLRGYDYALLVSKKKNVEEIIRRLKEDK
jgi:hypothetical protein